MSEPSMATMVQEIRADVREMNARLQAQDQHQTSAIEAAAEVLKKHSDRLEGLDVVVRKNQTDIQGLGHRIERVDHALRADVAQQVGAEQKERELTMAEVRGMVRAIKIAGALVATIGGGGILTIVLAIRDLAGG